VYRQRLDQLSGEALRYEQTDSSTAMRIWRQALELLPVESEQYRMIYERMRLLAANVHVPFGDESPPAGIDYAQPAQARRRDTWGTAILKTAGSMILSIIVYAWFMGNFYFAAGFVLLILVHEMGHVLAMRYYGLNASPPIFIPFVGALINLREQPPNAKVEAIVRIGGPVTGTIGALACFAAYHLLPHHPILLELAFWGIFLNLFNLVPVPPLDGGRVTAAVSPWIWMLGIVAVVGMILANYIFFHQISFILIFVLILAWPRIRATLAARGRDIPYYRISRAASVSIGVAYLLLGGVLLTFFILALSQSHFTIM